MSELVISTASAPQPFPVAETFVLCLMVFGVGVLTGMLVAFGISGRRIGNPRAVVNLAGAKAAQKLEPRSANTNPNHAPASSPPLSQTRPKLTCTCKDGRCGLRGGGVVNDQGPTGTPPDRRHG